MFLFFFYSLSCTIPEGQQVSLQLLRLVGKDFLVLFSQLGPAAKVLCRRTSTSPPPSSFLFLFHADLRPWLLFLHETFRTTPLGSVSRSKPTTGPGSDHTLAGRSLFMPAPGICWSIRPGALLLVLDVFCPQCPCAGYRWGWKSSIAGLAAVLLEASSRHKI